LFHLWRLFSNLYFEENFFRWTRMKPQPGNRCVSRWSQSGRVFNFYFYSSHCVATTLATISKNVRPVHRVHKHSNRGHLPRSLFCDLVHLRLYSSRSGQASCLQGPHQELALNVIACPGIDNRHVILLHLLCRKKYSDELLWETNSSFLNNIDKLTKQQQLDTSWLGFWYFVLFTTSL